MLWDVWSVAKNSWIVFNTTDTDMRQSNLTYLYYKQTNAIVPGSSKFGFNSLTHSGWVDGEQKRKKIALRCNADSTDVLVLILNVKKLYESDTYDCFQFVVKY